MAGCAHQIWDCLRKTILASSFLSIAACGGGGGGGGSASPSPTPPATPAPPPGPTFSVTGTLTGSSFLVADSDVNDSFTGIIRNNTVTTAQAISVPAIIKGYVTESATGVSGDNFQSVNDAFDVYSLEIEAGQSIILEIADFDFSNPAAVNLNISVLDINSNSIGFSSSLTRTEQLTIATAGSYFLVVSAEAGASNYTVTISSELANTNIGAPVEVARIAPHQIEVRKTPRNAVQAMNALSPVMTTQSLSSFSGGLKVGDIIDVNPTDIVARSLANESGADWSEVLKKEGVTPQSVNTDPLYEQRIALLRQVNMMNRAEGQDTFAVVQQPELFQISSDPTPDPFLQWNLPDIGWQEAQNLISAAETANGGAFPYRPLIAVIDSGVKTDHPEISSVLVDQREFVASFFDGDGFEAEAEEQVRP
ncbi:MAG: hypothetical protein AAF603_06790, partial [Pseudomonadota bacterium]